MGWVGGTFRVGVESNGFRRELQALGAGIIYSGIIYNLFPSGIIYNLFLSGIIYNLFSSGIISGYWISEFGVWILVVGVWTLDVGFWGF